MESSEGVVSKLVQCLVACFDALELIEYQNTNFVQLYRQMGVEAEKCDGIVVNHKPAVFFRRRYTQPSVSLTDITITDSSINVLSKVNAKIRYTMAGTPPTLADHVWAAAWQFFEASKNTLETFIYA